MIKGSMQEKDITIISVYASNIESPKYIRQILMDRFLISLQEEKIHTWYFYLKQWEKFQYKDGYPA